MSTSSSLCSNCEFNEVELRCIQCIEAKEDGLFCGNCSRIHVKIKKFKQHVFEKVIRPSPFCFNCEEQIATHRCVDCIDGEQYLCRTCSSFHGKVKCFKDHRVVKHTSDDSDRTTNDDSKNNNISITYSSPSLFQRMEDIVDDWNSWYAHSRLSNLLDFTHVKTPPPKVYIPLIIGTAISFLILRPLIGKHGSSVVTILGSLIVLRIMQSPPSINQNMDEWNSKANRTGKQKRVQIEDYSLTPSLMPQLTGSGKLSRQRNNPPFVLKSALTSGNHTISPTLMTTDTSQPSTLKNKSNEVGKKKNPVQFGAMAGWEDNEEEFPDEFSYKRCSEAATLKPRGPAYHGRTRHKRKNSDKNPADSDE